VADGIADRFPDGDEGIFGDFTAAKVHDLGRQPGVVASSTNGLALR
jgi:hypothetical protein